ncbi:MAG: HlyD family efflux transporter periplasmic adaptor subunit [Pseudomonadales bacterium]|nr:HlyD family efflux transporter periplasmic adaptor subunit [Pseudomonadales bacterium]MCP5330027.1 HlyD family efflux transporter periplasmic adaptor subunit [Pseudomonadales bacterium]MCP5343064.1 HlyD family efflux transporter periplasmic adaptor subunit [Pseudomonadales bacterium]
MKISDTSAQDTPLDPPVRNRALRTFAIVAVAGVAALLFLVPLVQNWSRAQASVAAERLRIGEVTRGDFIRDVTVQGRVVAAVSPTLYASESGTITFLVESGDSVQAGDAIASIDSPEIQNRLLQERSRLSSLHVEYDRQRISGEQQRLESQKSRDSVAIALKAAQRELERAQRAYDQGVMTQVDLDKARDSLETAEVLHHHADLDAGLVVERLDFELQTRKLAVEQQTLLVEDLNRQVEELTLRSPVSGIVGNLLTQQKTNVARNQAVLSVVDLSAFEVEVQVPETYVNDLAIGMLAQVRAGTDLYPATLLAVSPEIIGNQVTGRLRFERPAPDNLRQNQRLTTRILLEEKHQVLMVPRGQFVESGNGRVAYRLRDGMAYRTSIVIGATSLSSVEILEGLEEGDHIVVSSTDAFNNAGTVLVND